MKKSKLLLILLLIFTVACSKNNDNKNNSPKNNIKENNKINTNIEKDKEEKDKELTLSGENENFQVMMTVEKLDEKEVKKVKEKIKEKSGEDSLEYTSFPDGEKVYKLTTNLKYVGEPIDGIQDLENYKINISFDNNYFIKELTSNEDIVKSLQAMKPIEFYITSDQKDFKDASENSLVNISSKDNSIEALNFNIELKEVDL
ncbi:MAG: hypothetical protein ACTHWZ_04390 [Peptoniphilaceae bacterium]